jgi:hypothetical protein
MPRTELSDEMLMAYADGELDAANADRVDRALREDPAIAVRIAGFLRSRRLSRAALGPVPGPVPPVLESAMRGLSTAAAKPSGGGTTARPELHRWLEWWRRSFLGLGAGLAGAVALAGLAGYLLAPGHLSVPPANGLVALLELPETGSALSTVLTGETKSLGGGRLRAIATYRLPDGAVCRDVVLDRNDEAAEAVACRSTSEQRWKLRVAVLTDAGGDGYAPASGKSVIDSFLELQGAQSPTTGEAERKLLQGSTSP